jgi:hypothetical protein
MIPIIRVRSITPMRAAGSLNPAWENMYESIMGTKRIPTRKQKIPLITTIMSLKFIRIPGKREV